MKEKNMKKATYDFTGMCGSIDQNNNIKYVNIQIDG
jgi:hypothetical protein